MKEAIVILGMHRSGTSTISGIFSIAGYFIGNDILPPSNDNIKGFFENRRITNFNDELLKSLHSKWFHSFFIPDNWWQQDEFLGQFDKGVQILKEEFDQANHLLLKDPRLSLLLPFYLRIFEKLNIKPSFIITVRNPIAIAESLQKRNLFTFNKSLLLWMDYTLKAELFTRNQPRVFISYADLLENPVNTFLESVKLLNLSCPISDDLKSLIDGFVENNLNHSTAKINLKEIKLPIIAKELYQKVSRLNLKVLDEKDLTEFDQLRDSFKTQFDFYHAKDENYILEMEMETKSGKSITISKGFFIGYNYEEFEIEQNEGISAVKIRPLHQAPAILIKRIKINDLLVDLKTIQDISCTKNLLNNDGYWIFESELHEIYLRLEFPYIIDRIAIEVIYFVSMDYIKDILYQDLFYWKENFDELKNVQDKLIKSWTWKIGKLITTPIKFLSSLFSNLF